MKAREDKIDAVETVLTIAGFDPSSGAGVTSDLMVFAAHGLFGTSCITGLTVQSTLGVRACHPVDPAILADSLACLNEDLPPTGIKIGMLGSKSAVAVVCDFLETLRKSGSRIPVVLDPVLKSSSGRELLESNGVDLLRRRLLPLADWVTPNRTELRWLTNSLGETDSEIAELALTLQRTCTQSCGRPMHIYTTGGDSIPPNDLLLLPSGESHWLRGEHVATSSTHGTGCALSSALLGRLVLGDSPVVAATQAKLYVTEALRQAAPMGRGHGPLAHLWPLRRPS